MATRLQLLINMIASSFGTGILSMPWSTAGASLIPALLIVLVISVLMVFTINSLIRAGDRHQKADLGALLGMLPGTAGWLTNVFVNVALWSTLWAILVGYVITIADALEQFVPGHRATIVIVSSAVLLPLCFLDMSRLSITSSFSLVATANLFLLLCSTLEHKIHIQEQPADVCGFGLADGLISMASNCCTCLIVQMCALQMYNELDERNPDVFMRITGIAFTVLFFVYSAFSIIGYLGYGATASSNILSNLPFDIDEYGGGWGKASRISFLVVIVAAYPIFLYPMISSLRNSDYLREVSSNDEDPLNDTPRSAHNTRRRFSPALVSGVATVLIVLTAMVAALFIKDLGFINVVVGAVQCAVFVGVCPSLVGIFLLGEKSENLQWRILMVILMILCCLLGFVGLIFTKNYADDVTAHCKWFVFQNSSQVSLSV